MGLPIIHTLILASVLLKPNLKLTHTYIRTAPLVTIMEWAILKFIIIPTALTLGMESVLLVLKQNLRLIHISCTMEMGTIMALVLATLAIIILIQPILESDLQMLNLNLLLHMVPMATDCIMVLDILVSTIPTQPPTMASALLKLTHTTCTMDTLVLATTMGLPTLVFTYPMLTLDKQTASLPFHLDDIFSVLDDFDTKQENMSML